MNVTRGLSTFEKVGYGLGDAASNLIWVTLAYFQLNFYTDVYGLSAGSVATMLLITRTWDMALDISIGMASDRTKTRWGRYRPYILWMALPLGIAAVAAFTTPPFSPFGKLVYAYVTLSLLTGIYSAINTPYTALMGVVSPTAEDRTSLAAWRLSCAFGAGLMVQYLTLRLVTLFGHGNPQLGYLLTVGLYAVVAVPLFLVTFVSTRERVKPIAEENKSAALDLSDLAKNVPWLVLCIVGIAGVFSASIRGAAVIYYFKYYIGGIDAVAMFLLTGSLVSLAGTFLIQYIANYFGRKKTFVALALLAGADLIASYWVRPDQLWLLYLYNVIYCLLTGPTLVLLWSMFTDVADYSEWKTGRRAMGLVLSAAGISNKIGWVIGGALTAALLAASGFQANAAQTAYTQNYIRILMAILPAVGTIASGIGMLAYTLDESKMKTIHSELARTRETPIT